MVINGSVFGINVIGNITPAQLKKAAEISATIQLLQKQLAELFDERLASLIIQRLGECAVTLENGETPTELQRHLELLHTMGLIGKCRE